VDEWRRDADVDAGLGSRVGAWQMGNRVQLQKRWGNGKDGANSNPKKKNRSKERKASDERPSPSASGVWPGGIPRMEHKKMGRFLFQVDRGESQGSCGVITGPSQANFWLLSA
jgi:hypothetical protein